MEDHLMAHVKVLLAVAAEVESQPHVGLLVPQLEVSTAFAAQPHFATACLCNLLHVASTASIELRNELEGFEQLMGRFEDILANHRAALTLLLHRRPPARCGCFKLRLLRGGQRCLSWLLQRERGLCTRRVSGDAEVLALQHQGRCGAVLIQRSVDLRAEEVWRLLVRRPAPALCGHELRSSRRIQEVGDQTRCQRPPVSATRRAGGSLVVGLHGPGAACRGLLHRCWR
mmetsp:Transcript_44792/g.104376  ORF Transcript_44792/g.104376 Transcript_44792/m.104376 type:complete len:229 (-) Transcript_44792:241-927(-)